MAWNNEIWNTLNVLISKTYQPCFIQNELKCMDDIHTTKWVPKFYMFFGYDINILNNQFKERKLINIIHYLNTVFHGDTPPRVGGSPPMLPTPRGLGGSMGNISQRPPFCETWEFPGLGGSHMPLPENGGLQQAPTALDFLNFLLKKEMVHLKF